ncbi:hypothetical protein D3C72_1092030 [compost metagenome]
MDGRHGGRHQRRNAEISAMRQAGDEAQDGEAQEIRCKGAQDIADRKKPHQAEKQGTTRYARGKHRNDRRADDDAERIGGDDVTRLRNGDAIGGGNVRQKAHDGEFTGADAEAAGGKRQFDKCDGKRGEGHGRRCRVNGFILRARAGFGNIRLAHRDLKNGKGPQKKGQDRMGAVCPDWRCAVMKMTLSDP